MATYSVSYWLMPAKESRDHWRDVIKDLALRFGNAPVFEPHVTVYVSHDTPEQFSMETLKKSIHGIQKIELQPAKLEFTDKFTKSCFLSFQPSQPLTQISGFLQKNSIHKAAYELQPHMSLMYRQLNPTERGQVEQLISSLKPIAFDAIEAWATGSSPQSKSDVEAWKLVASARLG